MSATIGNRLRLTIFGESHQRAIGGVIDNLPAGIKLDMNFINQQMKRRAPSLMKHSTSRKEADEVEIISGYFNDKTTGAPLAFMIKNKDVASSDYEKTKDLLRPGHADYAASVRYDGHNDYRGGGHFSGRLTACLVFAGAIAQQLLMQKDIRIISHISSIENVRDKDFDKTSIYHFVQDTILSNILPVMDKQVSERMMSRIESARDEGDSVGGTVECAVTGIKAGLGEPFFDSMESRIAHMIFSVPAVKGIEFGAGFDIAKMRGSKSNDQIEINALYNNACEYDKLQNNINHITNNDGGITGGITNGMPVIFKVAVKPTPSISKLQHTVNKETMTNEDLEIKGRHDACIVPRVVPVIEACAAFTVLDMLLERGEHFES